MYRCRVCKNAAKRKRYLGMSVEERRSRFAYKDWSKTWPKMVKGRATRIGVPYNLTDEDFIVPAKCPVLGIPLQRHTGSSGPRPDSPTIDRIVPELGYVKGNVRVVSHRANTLRGNRTAQGVIEMVAGRIKRYLLPTEDEQRELLKHRVDVACWVNAKENGGTVSEEDMAAFRARMEASTPAIVKARRKGDDK